MAQSTKFKVTLTSEAYEILKIEAMLMEASMKHAASRIIKENASPKARELLVQKQSRPRHIKNNPAAIEKIKRLREQGVSHTDIAQIVGYSTDAVRDYLKSFDNS